MVEVVAALIREGGKILICQRKKGKARELLWEFVGGKVEAGESHAEALVRECREELQIEVSVGKLFAEVVHSYPDITVHLFLYEARWERGKMVLSEHEAVKWVTPEMIQNDTFCPADIEILEKIKREANTWQR